MEDLRKDKVEGSYELDLDDTISHWDLLVDQAIAAVEKTSEKREDAEGEDAGAPDAAEPDAGTPAAGTPDAAEPDAKAAAVAEDRGAAPGRIGAPPPVESAEKERIRALEAETQTLRDRLTRTLADFDNFRKRTERDKALAQRYALFDVFKDFLHVYDNLERALAASGSAEDLKRGVEMIARLFHDLLRRYDIESIEAVGKPFDPTIHEAVAREEGTGVTEPTVTTELQRGYRLHDRLLRPSMVSVAMPAAPPPAAPPPAAPPPAAPPEESPDAPPEESPDAAPEEHSSSFVPLQGSPDAAPEESPAEAAAGSAPEAAAEPENPPTAEHEIHQQPVDAVEAK